MTLTVFGVGLFRCGHPKTTLNTYQGNRQDGTVYTRCRECDRVRARARHQPPTCVSCGEPLGGGRPEGWHAGACEPTTCTCPDGGHPNGLGECATCRRLVPSHSWHLGRP